MSLTQQDLGSITQLLKKELRPIKKDINDIKATQNLIIGQFDLRLNHLEKHTIHPPGKPATTFVTT